MSSKPTASTVLVSRSHLTGDQVTTMLLRMPRCILSEFNTHRAFSRNAASSRAIPVEKMLAQIENDPFVPLVWGRNQPGMQAFSFHDDPPSCEREWLLARDSAVASARRMTDLGLHKQIVNRLVEPWMWTTVVCTATNWSNFLHLRDHADAEPHIAMLAREIRKALEGATPQVLQPGDWHLPFVRDEDSASVFPEYGTAPPQLFTLALNKLIKLSVARCASTSYDTVDGFEMTIDRAVALHDKLVAQDPLHASPCEHQCTPDGFDFVAGRYHAPEKHGNLKGFVQYRKTLSGECR